MEIIKPKLNIQLNKNKIITGAVLFLLIMAVFVLIAYVLGLFKELVYSPAPMGTPGPTVVATQSAIRTPSSLSKTQDFIDIETTLDTLDKDLLSVDLSEPKLSLPILELDISFN